MKARIKGTNTIVECLEVDFLNYVGFGIKCKHSDGSTELISGDCLIELENDFNWQSFRAEAAREFISSIISSGVGITPKDAVDFSIQMTDELIERLKGKEEK